MAMAIKQGQAYGGTPAMKPPIPPPPVRPMPPAGMPDRPQTGGGFMAPPQGRPMPGPQTTPGYTPPGSIPPVGYQGSPGQQMQGYGNDMMRMPMRMPMRPMISGGGRQYPQGLPQGGGMPARPMMPPGVGPRASNSPGPGGPFMWGPQTGGGMMAPGTVGGYGGSGIGGVPAGMPGGVRSGLTPTGVGGSPTPGSMPPRPQQSLGQDFMNKMRGQYGNRFVL